MHGWLLFIVAVFIAAASIVELRAYHAKQRKTRVVVYGVHSPDWTSALTAGAEVWKKIPAVGEVLLIGAPAEAKLPKSRLRRTRTVVIPLMEPHVASCPPGYPALIPDAVSLRVLGDKIAFAKYARANGLDRLCPVTYSGAADAAFPCILKSRGLNGGLGVALVNSRDHLRQLLSCEPWRGERVLLQALVGGAIERVTHCICWKGKIIWHCTFEYDMGSPAEIRGPGNARHIRPAAASARSLMQIERFLAPLRYTGPCNIDYKLLKDGGIAIFEINPRLGGSLMRPEYVEYLRGALSCIVETALQPPSERADARQRLAA